MRHWGKCGSGSCMPTASDGKIVTKICKAIAGVSVLNRGDWPELISFFKQRMIALDAFWENARYSFDALK